MEVQTIANMILALALMYLLIKSIDYAKDYLRTKYYYLVYFEVQNIVRSKNEPKYLIKKEVVKTNDPVGHISNKDLKGYYKGVDYIMPTHYLIFSMEVTKKHLK